MNKAPKAMGTMWLEVRQWEIMHVPHTTTHTETPTPYQIEGEGDHLRLRVMKLPREKGISLEAS